MQAKYDELAANITIGWDREWTIRLLPFLSSEAFWNIWQQIKRDAKWEKVFPKPEDVFRVFKECAYGELKSVWVGLSPYYSMDKNTVIADGRAFSCSNTMREQPSLTVLYDAIQADLGVDECDRYPSLEFLSKQGVLLLNVALTCKEKKADSHVGLWQPFQDYLWKNVLDTCVGVPIILFGNEAKKGVEKHLFPLSQPYKVTNHPSFHARQQTPIEKGLFKWLQATLESNNGPEFKINFNYTEWLNDQIPF